MIVCGASASDCFRAMFLPAFLFHGVAKGSCRLARIHILISNLHFISFSLPFPSIRSYLPSREEFIFDFMCISGSWCSSGVRQCQFSAPVEAKKAMLE